MAAKDQTTKTVRIPEPLHHLLRIRAAERRAGINEMAAQMIRDSLDGSSVPKTMSKEQE